MSAEIYAEGTGKVYEIEFYPNADGWQITIGDYIRKCEHNRIPADRYRKCFICGRFLSAHRYPLLISVSGIGIRFACTGCFEQHGGNSLEKAEL